MSTESFTSRKTSTISLGVAFTYEALNDEELFPPMWELEAALRQWRRLIGWSLTVGVSFEVDHPKSVVEFEELRKRLWPTHFVRVKQTRLESPWHTVMDTGPVIVAMGATGRVLFYLVRQAFRLPLEIKVERADLRRQLEEIESASHSTAFTPEQMRILQAVVGEVQSDALPPDDIRDKPSPSPLEQAIAIDNRPRPVPTWTVTSASVEELD